MGDRANLWRGRRWAELVALTLQVEGIESASPRAIARSAASFGDDGPMPDIEGVPGVWLDTAAASFTVLGSYLDTAASAAEMEGLGRVPAVALYRQRRPAAEAYAVVRLSDLARLVLAAQKTQATS